MAALLSPVGIGTAHNNKSECTTKHFNILLYIRITMQFCFISLVKDNFSVPLSVDCKTAEGVLRMLEALHPTSLMRDGV